MLSQIAIYGESGQFGNFAVPFSYFFLLFCFTFFNKFHFKWEFQGQKLGKNVTFWQGDSGRLPAITSEGKKSLQRIRLAVSSNGAHNVCFIYAVNHNSVHVMRHNKS